MIRHGNENCVIAFRGGGDRMDLEFVEFCGIERESCSMLRTKVFVEKKTFLETGYLFY